MATATIAAIASGYFLTLGLRFVLPALVPSIKASFGIDNTTAGLAITVVWAGDAIMRFPPVYPLTDSASGRY